MFTIQQHSPIVYIKRSNTNRPLQPYRTSIHNINLHSCCNSHAFCLRSICVSIFVVYHIVFGLLFSRIAVGYHLLSICVCVGVLKRNCNIRIGNLCECVVFSDVFRTTYMVVMYCVRCCAAKRQKLSFEVMLILFWLWAQKASAFWRGHFRFIYLCDMKFNEILIAHSIFHFHPRSPYSLLCSRPFSHFFAHFLLRFAVIYFVFHVQKNPQSNIPSSFMKFEIERFRLVEFLPPALFYSLLFFFLRKTSNNFCHTLYRFLDPSLDKQHQFSVFFLSRFVFFFFSAKWYTAIVIVLFHFRFVEIFMILKKWPVWASSRKQKRREKNQNTYIQMNEWQQSEEKKRKIYLGRIGWMA